jgi:hypothetical protein
MTQDEIIDLARQAGFPTDYNGKRLLHNDELVYFANMVEQRAWMRGYTQCDLDNKTVIHAFTEEAVEEEREELCKAMEAQDTWDLYDPGETAIKVIRARGKDA